MSNGKTVIILIRGLVEQYLANQLLATELVRIVDDLAAQDRLHGLDLRCAELVGSLHEALALYVPDERTRREEPGIYIGEEELRQKAAEFLANLDPPIQPEKFTR